MKEARDPYELVREIYAVLGRAVPDRERFLLDGVTITINGHSIEIAERGVAIGSSGPNKSAIRPSAIVD